MKRRDFLKYLGIAIGAALLAPFKPFIDFATSLFKGITSKRKPWISTTKTKFKGDSIWEKTLSDTRFTLELEEILAKDDVLLRYFMKQEFKNREDTHNA